MKSNLTRLKKLFLVFTIACLFSSCEDEDLFMNYAGESTVEKSGPLNLISGTIGFRQVGPVGGGYPNVVTWDPNEPGTIYYGSDVGGTGRSTDFGRNFQSVARGLNYEKSHEKIAALNAVDINGRTVIVGGTGHKGVGGEVISSSDGGDSWKVDSKDISFSAQNSDAPLPQGRPRSTDPTLIQWVGGSIWVAGTYKDGVYISKDNRSSWNEIKEFRSNKDIHIRAMAISPDDPNTVYVGLWGDHSSLEKGLWEISKLNKTPSAKKVSGIPDVVESIVVLGDRMYLACGEFGVRKFIPSSNSVTNISGPIRSSVMATAIHGVERGSNRDRIVLGTADGNGDVWVSENSGTSWDNTTGSSSENVTFNPWGSNDNLLVFDNHKNWALGGSKCDIAAVQISPHDPDVWVVCATSAIWTTPDAGATWRPANGFQILSYRDVEISPTGAIAAGNVDHDVLISNDGGSEWNSIGLGGVTVAHALTFSTDGEELAFANNERDGNSGAKLGVASSPTRPSSPSLVEVNDMNAPNRIVGMTWFKFPLGTERLVMAVDGGGIQTVDRAEDGIWDNWKFRSTALMGPQNNDGLRCSMVSYGRIIFVYDRDSGVWRSKNSGVDWTQILDAETERDQGYLAYDGEEDRLYISTSTDVLRIDNASISEATTNLSIPANRPGAMALDPSGRLLVFVQPQNAGNADCALYRSNNPESGQPNWVDKADHSLKNIAPVVTDMDVSDELIVMVTSGKGIIISENDAP